jgi:long-chain acyl-CoA synthetase
MGIVADLKQRHPDPHVPFLIHRNGGLCFRDLLLDENRPFSEVSPGDVVALIGDFDAPSISALVHLLDADTILMPLTRETRQHHPYYFDAAQVDVVIEGDVVIRLGERRQGHPMLEELRRRRHPGLVLFSSGTSGHPKAILHDFAIFLRRYRSPRPALRALSFLLFDHIGGINTLLHTLYNKGSVVVPSGRTPDAVLRDLVDFKAELLPTTPTFLRMLLLSGLLNGGIPESLKLVTYGAERMDEGTLRELCRLLPSVDFRQTYGMSELGILRVKTRARDSLWMKIGGDGVETRVVDGVLHIKAPERMVGYLNEVSPFDAQGWYDTQDLVEQDGDWVRIIGRNSERISVGGIKFLPGEVERAAMQHADVRFARARGVDNPITGQHVELTVELIDGARTTRQELRRYLKQRLPEYMHPHRIKTEKVSVGHRFKRE